MVWQCGSSAVSSAARGGGHHLQHQHGGASVLQVVRVLAQSAGGFVGFALHAVAAQGVYGLGCQAQVGADGHAALHQKFHRRCRPATAFELDHVRTRLHQRAGAAQGLFTAFCVGAVGQVGHQPGGALHTLQAPGHAGGVVGHGV